MNRKWWIIASGVFLGLGLLWWLSTASHFRDRKGARASGNRPTLASTPVARLGSSNVVTIPPSPEEKMVRRGAVIQNIVGVLTTPIAFYGKVIDQNGAPVQDAKVKYSAMDKFDAPGTTYNSRSDVNGLFSINGIQGAVLTVGVWKEGYHVIDDKSTGAFAYGAGPDSTRKVPPTADNPALFILRKMGPTEPLVEGTSGQIDVPTAGQPVNIDLANPRVAKGGALELRSWVKSGDQRRFDWRYSLSVPDGGLVERKDQFDFEAPVEGYQPVLEMEMSDKSKERSSNRGNGYFARLPDGRYARFLIKLYPGKRNFVVIESYVNPNPGSRNLEFDPAKRVKISGD